MCLKLRSRNQSDAEDCRGDHHLTQTSLWLLLSLHVLGIGHLSKPVVGQGRRNKFSRMKKEKCLAEGGNKALIPHSLKINSYERLKR